MVLQSLICDKINNEDPLEFSWESSRYISRIRFLMELGPGSGFLKVLIWIWSELHDPDQWIQIHKPSKSAVIVVFFFNIDSKESKGWCFGVLERRLYCNFLLLCIFYFVYYIWLDIFHFSFILGPKLVKYHVTRLYLLVQFYLKEERSINQNPLSILTALG